MSDPHPKSRSVAINGRNVALALIIVLVVALIPGRIALHKRNTYLQQANADNVQTVLVKQQVQLGQLVQAHLSKYQKELKQDEQAVPAAYSLPQLVQLMTAMATAAGVTWTSASPSTEAAAASSEGVPGTLAYPMTITVDGTAAAVSQFVRQLQQQAQLFTITNLVVSYPDGGRDVLAASAQINLVSYVANAYSPVGGTTTTTTTTP
jgi:hypothetical protein